MTGVTGVTGAHSAPEPDRDGDAPLEMLGDDGFACEGDACTFTPPEGGAPAR